MMCLSRLTMSDCLMRTWNVLSWNVLSWHFTSFTITNITIFSQFLNWASLFSLRSIEKPCLHKSLLYTSHLSDVQLACISPSPEPCLFILIVLSFAKEKFVIWMKYGLSFFMDYAFGVMSKNSWSISKSWRHSLMFSFKVLWFGVVYLYVWSIFTYFYGIFLLVFALR